MTQIGMIDGEFVVNPSQEQWKVGDLNLTVASTSEKVIMIEAGANEVPEAKMLEAIYMAHEINQTLIEFIRKIVAETGKAKHEYTSCAVPEEMFEEIKKIVSPEEMEEAVFTDEKQVREENIRKITPPGIFPTAYNFSSYSTLKGKKSIPSLGFSEAVAVQSTVVSPYCIKAQPFACFPTLPISTFNVLPARSIVNVL